MLEGEIEELKQEKETNEKKLKRDHEVIIIIIITLHVLLSFVHVVG